MCGSISSNATLHTTVRASTKDIFIQKKQSDHLVIAVVSSKCTSSIITY